MHNELRDIKPLLEIPDNSYYFYIGVLSFLVILLFILIFIVVKKFILNRKETLHKRYLRALKNIDWNDAKKSAYLATKLGRVLAVEDRQKDIYWQFVRVVERYKYKKEVPAVDEETLQKYNLLVHILDE